MKPKQLKAFPFVFYRTTVLPANAFSSSNLHHPYLLNAIKLASKSLSDSISAKSLNNKDKSYYSLLKYLNRLCYRCTPFGLFAGIGVANLGESSTVPLIDTVLFRPDTPALIAFARAMCADPEIRAELLYYTNTSCYKVHKQLRYIERTSDNHETNHQLNAVAYNPYLLKVLELAEKGASISQLTNLLINEEINEEESAQFIQYLIDVDLLKSELEPALCGELYETTLLKKIQKLCMHSNSERLHYYKDWLEGFLCSIKTLPELKQLKKEKCRFNLPSIPNPTLINKQTLQATIIFNHPKAELANSVTSELLEAVAFLNSFLPANTNKNLETFKEKFKKRFGIAEIPLVKVLDMDTGIGYPSDQPYGISTLVSDIHLSKTYKNKTPLTDWEKKLELLVANALKKQQHLELNTEQSPVLMPATHLPSTFAMFFKFCKHNLIYLETVGGNSGINTLTRFANLSPAISEAIKQVTEFEKEMANEGLFAEIVYLPEDRLGNILNCQSIAKTEILVAGDPMHAEQHQLPIKDLMISLVGNKLQLRSVKLNRIIVPRLSSAHNYFNSKLPAYRLLCDLQHQQTKSSLHFTWGNLSSIHHHLPRVSYKNILLHPASWNLNKEHLTEFIQEYQLSRKISDACKKFQLPKEFVLLEGDQELTINSEHAEALDLFIYEIRNKSQVYLQESLYCQNSSPFVDANGDKHNGEFICIVKNQDKDGRN